MTEDAVKDRGKPVTCGNCGQVIGYAKTATKATGLQEKHAPKCAHSKELSDEEWQESVGKAQGMKEKALRRRV